MAPIQRDQHEPVAIVGMGKECEYSYRQKDC